MDSFGSSGSLVYLFRQATTKAGPQFSAIPEIGLKPSCVDLLREDQVALAIVWSTNYSLIIPPRQWALCKFAAKKSLEK